MSNSSNNTRSLLLTVSVFPPELIMVQAFHSELYIYIYVFTDVFTLLAAVLLKKNEDKIRLRALNTG